MKTYYVQIGISYEREAFDIMSENGEILSRGGGFPVCPTFVNWRGTEKGVEMLRMLEVEIKELPETTKKRAVSAKDKVMNYVEELMGDGAFDTCSDEECEEIRQKFQLIFVGEN